MALHIERVQIPLGSTSFGGYLARPDDGAPRPAVLVFMEIFGINVHIRSVVERIAAQGYVALAPDIFHRTGPGMELGYDQAGLDEGRKHLRALVDTQLLADVDASLDYLDQRADVKLGAYGATGFCVGGHVAYLAATTGRLRAAASFYGGGIAAQQGFGGGPAPLSRAGHVRGRVLFLFGGRDRLIPMEQVTEIERVLAQARVDHEVVVYDQAGHGFFCELRDSYDPEAAADAWSRLEQLFAAHL